MFQNNQRQKTQYNKTCEEEKSQQDPPNSGEACEFQKPLYDQPIVRNAEAKWLENIEEHSAGIDIQ